MSWRNQPEEPAEGAALGRWCAPGWGGACQGGPATRAPTALSVARLPPLSSCFRLEPSANQGPSKPRHRRAFPSPHPKQAGEGVGRHPVPTYPLPIPASSLYSPKTRGAWEETAPHPQEAAGRTSHPSHRGAKARGGSGSLPGGIFGLEPTPSPTSSAGRAAGGTEISTLPWIKGWAHSSFPNEGITTECA